MHCSVTTEAGATTALEPETLFDFVELELLPGDTGSCQWFNVESEPRSGPSLGISLLLHTCPEGFDVTGGDYQTCTLPLEDPITFDFIRNGQVAETGTAASPATELRFTTNDGKPQAGEWTIRPNVSPDRLEPGWVCWGVDSAGQAVAGIDYFSPTDGGTGISAKFGPNLMLQCDVWLYAGDLSAYVAVTASTCPAGFDATNPAAGDRDATCAKTPRIGFIYTVDDDPVGEGETSSNGLAITPKQPGQWRSSAVPGEGLGVTFVTCAHTRAALNQVQTIEPTINADGRSIILDLDEGGSLRCEFFFGPMAAAEETVPGDESAGADDPAEEAPGATTDGGTSSFSIQHYVCEIPVADLSTDELVETCTASLEPSAWVLNGEPLDVGDGYAVWDGLEPGTVSVSKGAAQGKDDTASAVYCSIAPTDGVPLVGIEVPDKDGAIELVFDQPAIVYCGWFIAP